MYTVQTRTIWVVRSFISLEAALQHGQALGVPFDVSADSGALVWVWEMRS